ncbi:uncharacterized protein TNCV_2054591 [Trichonephila clavipes]|nr:uncharacterized protein TNCV_2054591 [Trichonephila clavipes]
MQNSAPPHVANPVKQLLKGHAENARVISHHFPTAFPPKSPDLNLCDFWLRGYLKDAVFSVPTARLAELRRGKCVTFFGGVRGTPRNSSACKQQQGRYTNYCCNPYGKAAPITSPLRLTKPK